MSRLAVISDVHANLHALRAVLAALSEMNVDRFLCAGDIVGYGPHPNECVEVLSELPLVGVAGNHDLVALGRADLDRCGRLARRTLEWTTRELDDSSRRYLDSLPVVFSEPPLAMSHGSLADRFEYIDTEERAASQLVQLAADIPEARVLLLGHTHVPMAFAAGEGFLDARPGRVRLRPDERYVLNPGSVGQSRDRSPDASCLVLDLAAEEATFLRVAYDIRACRRALRRRGLPVEACHRVPTPDGFLRRNSHRITRLARDGRTRLGRRWSQE